MYILADHISFSDLTFYFSFFDIHAGIADPAVFVPPTECM